MIISESFPIKSSRLTLKFFSEENVTTEYLSWLNNPKVVKYSNQRFKEHDYDSSICYFKSFFKTDNLFLVIMLDKEMIGTMTSYINKEHQTADIGIMLSPDFWSQGFASEAMLLLMENLFSFNIRKITGGTLSCNTAMIHVFKNSGMKLECIREKQEVFENKEVDIMCFCKFKDE